MQRPTKPEITAATIDQMASDTQLSSYLWVQHHQHRARWHPTTRAAANQPRW